MKKFVLFGLILFFGMAFLCTLVSQKKVSAKRDYKGIKKAVEWLRGRSSPGEIVFLRNWSNFPIAFFYNQSNNYTTGIEPKALEEYDSVLYWKWHNIFLYNYFCELPEDCGEEKDEITQSFEGNDEKKEIFEKENSKKIIYSIKEDFGSHLVLSDSSSFDDVLKKNPDLIAEDFSYFSNTTKIGISAFKLK